MARQCSLRSGCRSMDRKVPIGISLLGCDWLSPTAFRLKFCCRRCDSVGYLRRCQRSWPASETAIHALPAIARRGTGMDHRVEPGDDDQRRPAHPPCHYSNIIGAHHQHPKLLSVRNSPMSIGTLIVLGRGALAALRGVVRRWCRTVAWRSRHREHCKPKIPLPAPCRAGFVPVSGVKKLPARHTANGAGPRGTLLIRNGLSAMSSIKSRTPRRVLENFSLSSGTARERGLRRHTEKYVACGWWTTMAEVDCSGSSWSSSERVMPISFARNNARSCRWSARLGQG